MSEIRPSRRSLKDRLRLPDGFFNFDVKDTLRLIAWLCVTAFAMGKVYEQRDVDLKEIKTSASSVTERQDREMKMLREKLDEARSQVAKDADDTRRTLVSISRAVEAGKQTDAAVVAGLDGIRTELRYVNEKIDVLRQDLREGRPK
jgi:DNA-binding XRE family transcriptional regulator